MENAAMAAYLKDVENNTRDMTADRIIKEKLNKKESQNAFNFNSIPTAAPETVPRFKDRNQFNQEIDPCDPVLSKGMPSQPSRSHQKSECKSHGKNKGNKGKGKGRKTQEDDRPAKPVRKLWYEASSPEGYTYYWHVETNESVWEPPEEGYMTFAEQEKEAKEQALQQELLEQLEQEEAAANVDILEEKRANAERERLKELRKQWNGQPLGSNKNDTEAEDEETLSYRRDYSIPEKSHPYGPWRTVQIIETKPVDLQLPQQKQPQLPVFGKLEPPAPSQRTFNEKTVAQIDAGDSDQEDGKLTTFKKRKIGNKNVRKRLTED